jgi:polyhydroxybutyrate depolymerase
MAQTVEPLTFPGKRLRQWPLRVLVLLILAIGGLAGAFYSAIRRWNRQMLTGGRKRTYLLHVPKTYQPSRPTPLVICLPGFGEWPAHVMRISRWNQLADESGFLVVYPSGSSFPLRWHCDPRADTPEQARQDVQFISDLIDQLKLTYHIDEARVYANGLSNGGGMSFLLACRLSERIAAIGLVGGAYLLPWTEYTPKRPVPAIVFHGTSDPLVPFHGGPSRLIEIPFPDVPQWVQSLAERNRCQSNPVPLPVTGSASGLCYRGRTGNADVVFYAVAGGGHSWPGGEEIPTFLVGKTVPDVDATRLMWDFFQEHPMTR